MPLPSFLERFRRGSPTQAGASPLSSSDVEGMRVRARRRLIGMAVLVGAGVLGFPWLFETQPRPMASDIQIVQAPQASQGLRAPTLGQGAQAVASGPAQSATIAAVTTPAPRSAQPADAEREEFVTDAPASKPVAAPAKVASKPAPDKASEKAVDKASDKTADKAREKLANKPADKPADKASEKPADRKSDKERADKADKDKAATRYVVQFGAFADANAAQEARMKAERLGLKTYAQQVDTPQGKRIRVRLGPYTDKAEADKAAATLRKANLPGAVLTL